MNRIQHGEIPDGFLRTERVVRPTGDPQKAAL
jgi:hypothetical protein